MSIKVKYFASMRDRMGRGEDEIPNANGMTVADLWAKVADGADLPSSVLIAVNMEYTDGTHVVKEGDEVAFFPPVTGG
ncbi:Molybdopterin synthase sulfur carrier subunit [hydrothermal vent metagenome]|uniref:Molybdopterin synthase sulfur carrier subunit n=1 Tax=hydrothermal vent metagenome TaxID=652676 RepID=A0A3B0ZGU3_9ZZZZ